MNIALWIVAGVLAAAFLAAGAFKILLPKEKLIAIGGNLGEAFTGWLKDFSPGAVKAIGVLEFMAGVGLILPAVLDIAPIFVPLAALGLVLLMVGAIITHARRREAIPIMGNIFYLALAAFVAWGRFGPESFTG